VNFFDTAYVYPNSESTLGSILAKNDKRKDVFIATKMPLGMCKSANDFDRFFNEQLQRLQTDYIDYYLLHNIIDLAQWERLKELGIEKWIAGKKEEGKIKRIGFSYHGTCDDFLKLIDLYDWEFCLIQYNYYDENYQAGRKGMLVAVEKGISVMVMEPLLGGKLATGLPKAVGEIFSKADPELSPADRAFWWLFDQNELTVILSGMCSLQQLESNIRSVENFKPLTEDDKALYTGVIEEFKKSFKVKCTGCNYCLPCTKGINIPACFTAYNAKYIQGYITGISLYMTSTAAVTRYPINPRQCNDCGKCEPLCPQHIPIRKTLKKVSGSFEPLPMRILISILRKIMAR